MTTPAIAPQINNPSPLSELAPWRHPGLVFALVLYLLLAFSYFFVVPIFEGPDEWTHTGHVKYIAEGNGLPVMLPGRGIWGGQQPPLYYSLGALLAQPFELNGVEQFETQRRNPHASLGYALDPGNKNNYLHSPNENFPYRELSLTVHALRLYSMLYGVVALVFIYLTAYEIFDLRFTSYELRVSAIVLRIYGYFFRSNRNPSLATHLSPLVTRHLFATGVALFVACQPMFAFITASVANEPANIALSAVVVWLAQRYMLYGPAQHWRRALALGIALGLVSLSKMTGLTVGLVAVVAMLQGAMATRKQAGFARLLWRDGIIIGTAFLLIGGWWYWRNYQLYGDFFQQGLYKLYFNVDPQPLTLSEFLHTLSTGEISFWATFGWLNIVAPDWVYTLYRIISRVGLWVLIAVAVIQLITKFVVKQKLQKTPSPSPTPPGADTISRASRITQPLIFPRILIHLIFPAALAFSLTRLVATEGGLQGRQLLPALGSAAIVIMWGWWALLPGKIRLPGLGILLVVLFTVAIWLPFGVVAAEYTPTPILAESELPAGLIRLDRTFNDEIKLLGVQIGAEVVSPGQRVPVTVYWQALKTMDSNYSVFVHLIGRNYQSVGQFNTYPGLGLRPTTTLLPGQIIADTYPVLVEGGSQAPTQLLVNVGLFDFEEPGRPGIPAINSEGSELSPTIGRLKLIPGQWPALPDSPSVADFSDNIRLMDYNIDGCNAAVAPCGITFAWAAQGTPSADYTVFVQLWRDGESVGGFDTPPLNNDYPTALWAAGEVIIDPHQLELSSIAPGRYQILAGLYNAATGKRLPASTNGKPLPDFAVELGQIEIQ